MYYSYYISGEAEWVRVYRGFLKAYDGWARSIWIRV